MSFMLLAWRVFGLVMMAGVRLLYRRFHIRGSRTTQTFLVLIPFLSSVYLLEPFNHPSILLFFGSDLSISD